MERHARIFRFAGFELDPEQLELRSEGALVPLEPKPLRLLVFLIEHRDRWLSKETLFAALWPQEIVSDASLARAVRDVRRALGDTAAGQHWVRTRKKVGYRFIGDIEVVQDAPEPSASGGRRTRIYGSPRSASAAFTGRAEELIQLEALLARDSYGSVQTSIEGLAGVGKTEVALQLVYKLACDAKFSGGIFWLDAEDSDLQPQWGGTLADRCGVPEGSIHARAAELLRSIDRTLEPVLIVLDNVENWTTSSRPAPLPEGPHIHVLITTRERNLGGPQFAHLQLGVLRPPHDRELVERLAGRSVAPGLDELLQHLGGHALGLEIAGAFLRLYPGETASSYLHALLHNQESVEQEVRDRVSYERTVAETFRTVWSRLPEPGRQAWRIAACFAPELGSRELAGNAGLDRHALRTLEDVHLIRSDDGGRWQMHRLTRAFGQHAGTQEELHGARRQFVQGCLDRLSANTGDESWRVYVPDRKHFERALEAAASTPGLDSSALFTLQNAIGSALSDLGDPHGAKRLVQQALQTALKTPDENGTAIMTYRMQLALFLRVLGDKDESLRLAELALADSERLFGEGHPLVANYCGALARTYQRFGDFTPALTLTERALNILNADSSRNAEPIAAHLLRQAQLHYSCGNLEEAKTLMARTLAGNRTEDLSDPLAAIEKRSQLGWLLFELGDLVEGQRLQEQALETVIQRYGDTHIAASTYRSNLAQYLQCIGELRAAARIDDAALGVSVARTAGNPPSRLHVRIDLAQRVPIPEVRERGSPTGWGLAGSARQDFEVGIATSDAPTGRCCGYLRSKPSYRDGFGTLMQEFGAAEWRGLRLKMSAWCKTEAVDGWVGLWMRVDGKGESYRLDNMIDRAITGTTRWTQHEVVLDVPDQSIAIAFGVLLDGTGQTWVSDFLFQAVESDVPTTDGTTRPPRNLSFEEGKERGPSDLPGWFLGGATPRDFEVGTEPCDLPQGGQCGFLRAKPSRQKGSAYLMQTCEVGDLRGLRLKMSAWCGTDNAGGTANLLMELQCGPRTVYYDNMEGREIKGTTDWTQYQLVLDVPHETTTIMFGVRQDGPGQTSVTGFRFERAPSDTPVTGRSPSMDFISP